MSTYKELFKTMIKAIMPLPGILEDWKFTPEGIIYIEVNCPKLDPEKGEVTSKMTIKCTLAEMSNGFEIDEIEVNKMFKNEIGREVTEKKNYTKKEIELL